MISVLLFFDNSLSYMSLRHLQADRCMSRERTHNIGTHTATKSEFVGGTDVFAVWGLCGPRLSAIDHDAIVGKTGVLQH